MTRHLKYGSYRRAVNNAKEPTCYIVIHGTDEKRCATCGRVWGKDEERPACPRREGQ